MAQFNLCLNTITPRASDPSPLLPWWDKIRLYLHGRWSFAANKMSWLYHVALSPYNNTEEMEWVWDQAYVDWTNGKIIVQASNLSIKLRTSSKYDDCCLLYLPNVDARFDHSFRFSNRCDCDYSLDFLSLGYVLAIPMIIMLFDWSLVTPSNLGKSLK